VREQLPHRISGASTELEPPDHAAGDDVAVVRRSQRRREQQQRDQRRERLGSEDDGPVDALQLDEVPDASADE
jgi:hypothetical protein